MFPWFTNFPYRACSQCRRKHSCSQCICKHKTFMFKCKCKRKHSFSYINAYTSIHAHNVDAKIHDANIHVHAHNINADIHDVDIHAHVHNTDINVHGHNANVNIHVHSPSFKAHSLSLNIHYCSRSLLLLMKTQPHNHSQFMITHNSLLIITNRSFTKTRTSHINHILHKTCDSHKRTKTWKLEEIKLTYLETSKFKDFAHGSLLIASKFWLTTINNHISWMMNNLWLMNNLVDLPPIHGRLWLHYSTSISFPKALKFNNEYIIQLYCWSFTKSTTSIDLKSIQTPLATDVEIVLYVIATQKNGGWKCVIIAFKRNEKSKNFF
jgi:hypothetical protein